MEEKGAEPWNELEARAQRAEKRQSDKTSVGWKRDYQKEFYNLRRLKFSYNIQPTAETREKCEAAAKACIAWGSLG